MKLFIYLTFISGFTLGCSQQANHSQDTLSVKDSQVNSLHAKVDKIFTSNNLTSCEEKNKTMIDEVLHALDAHYGDIEKYANSPLKVLNFERHKLGPLWLREYHYDKTAEDKWKTDHRDWSTLYTETYKKLNSKSITGEWAYLFKETALLVSLDYDRVVNDSNLELDKDAGPLIDKASLQIESCLPHTQCTSPTFDAEIQTLLFSNTIYRWFLKQVSNQIDLDEKQKWWKKLANRLHYDHDQFYYFIISPHVKRVSENEFQINMNAGVFNEVKQDLENIILPRWAEPKYKVSINWVDVPEAYQLEMGTDLYGRSHSNTERMLLEPEATMNTVAHEFGHALGFPDKYYEVWRSSDCAYKEQYNEREIMSEPSLGTATDQDWQQLDSAYPWHSPKS